MFGQYYVKTQVHIPKQTSIVCAQQAKHCWRDVVLRESVLVTLPLAVRGTAGPGDV